MVDIIIRAGVTDTILGRVQIWIVSPRKPTETATFKNAQPNQDGWWGHHLLYERTYSRRRNTL